MKKILLGLTVLVSLVCPKTSEASRALIEFQPERLVFQIHAYPFFRLDPIRKMYDVPDHRECTIPELLTLQRPGLILPIDDVVRSGIDIAWLFTLSKTLRLPDNQPEAIAILTKNDPYELVDVVTRTPSSSFIYLSDPSGRVASHFALDNLDPGAFVKRTNIGTYQAQCMEGMLAHLKD